MLVADDIITVQMRSRSDVKDERKKKKGREGEKKASEKIQDEAQLRRKC